jgi:hypothetical protein
MRNNNTFDLAVLVPLISHLRAFEPSWRRGDFSPSPKTSDTWPRSGTESYCVMSRQIPTQGLSRLQIIIRRDVVLLASRCTVLSNACELCPALPCSGLDPESRSRGSWHWQCGTHISVRRYSVLYVYGVRLLLLFPPCQYQRRAITWVIDLKGTEGIEN